MGKSATNIAVVLGLITIAYGAYYLFTQYNSSSSDFDVNEQTMQNMLNNTRVFIERGQVLDGIALDISFFEDERFRSLQSYSAPIGDYPTGRPNPFAEVGQNSGI